MEVNTERVNYACSNCNYKFSRKAGNPVLRCPYCGKENTVEEYRADYASKVLDEVSSFDKGD